MMNTAHISTQTSPSPRPDKLGSETSAFRAPSLPTLSQEIIRILLAGLLAVLGLTRPERDCARERALRVRRSVVDTELYVNTRRKNKDIYNRWAGCGTAYWGEHMLRLWNHKRHQARADDNPHAARVRYSGVPGSWGVTNILNAYCTAGAQTQGTAPASPAANTAPP